MRDLYIPCPIERLSLVRTGKRGIPQLFPRRLYEMLEIESSSIGGATDGVVSWSSSGRAFRVGNVDLFSSQILPKYFRTAKFSSFQRNLNLVSLYYFLGLLRDDEFRPSLKWKCVNSMATLDPLKLSPLPLSAVWIYQDSARAPQKYVCAL